MLVKNKQHAFTIVELLIVIVVIGILAALVIGSYSRAQDMSRITAMQNTLRSYEKAFKTLSISAGSDDWVNESHFGLGGNPSINSIAADSRYSDHIKPLKDAYGVSSSLNWLYDNDGDTTGNCGAGAGINLFIGNANQKYIDLIEEELDDGDTNCGKYRVGGVNFFYVIGSN